MNFSFLLQKIRNRLSVKKKCIFRYFNVEKLSFSGWASFGGAKQFKSRLSMMLGAFPMLEIDTISSNEKSTIIDSAVRSLNHEFILLGSTCK